MARKLRISNYISYQILRVVHQTIFEIFQLRIFNKAKVLTQALMALSIDRELTGPSQTVQGSYTLISIVVLSVVTKSVLFAMSCRPQHCYNTGCRSS